jgi:NADH dehydrogenase
MSRTPTRIVIIGGGYTGIWAYKFARRQLRQEMRRGDVEVTVIAPKNYHSFHGWTAEALTGVISVANRQSPLRRIFKDQKVLRAYVDSINLEEQCVRVRHVADDHLEEVPYDHLLIANGSYDNMESVPGLKDFGWTVKASGGVQATRNQLIRAIEMADALPAGEEREKWMTVVVAGGGFAGVELAAGLAEMYKYLKRFYNVLKTQNVRIVLVHSHDKLLPILRPKFDRLADYCTRELEKHGVEICFNTRLEEVTADGAHLSNGLFIPSYTVICTVGQRADVLPGTESLPRSDRGLLIADEFLRVKGCSNVWVGGDAAAVPHIRGGDCPNNALWAIMHGVWAGKNIARTIKGKPLKKFDYRGLGQAASMGIGKGAAELYSVQFTGWVGWFLRFFFFLYFQPSRRQAVRVFGDWITLAFLGRYMTLSDEWQRQDTA